MTDWHCLDVAHAPTLHFDPNAQELFVAWLTELESKLRGIGLHPAFVSHLAKYRRLMPSLALLFHLADGGISSVSLQHAQQAAAWCEYLESHARRIYSMIISPQRQAAADLGRRLQDGWKREEGMFTVRDVYRNEWSGLDTPEKVRAALPVLVDAAWVREKENREHTGRPSEVYAISPHVPRRRK